MLSKEGLFAYRIFAFAGHIWPAVFGFKGGKGVATGIGLILTVNPEIGIIVLVTALIIMALTKTVSAGSVFGAVIFPITAYFVDSRYLLWARCRIETIGLKYT